MNIRLRELRKNILNLTLKSFGVEIGLSPGTIGDIESGRTPLQERHIKLICQTFNVNEDWLRNGVEPIFKEDNKEDDVLQCLKNKYQLDDTYASIIKSLVSLDSATQNKIVDFMFNVVKENIDKIDENKLKEFSKNLDKSNIKEFSKEDLENTSDKVKIIARGEGITYIDREEFEEIKRNSKKLTDDEISDFLD